MIFSKTYVLTGMVLGAALANDDITGNHLLTAKDFYTKAFAMRLAAVLTTTCSFFMCHFVGLFTELGLDGFDADTGKLLAMAALYGVTFAALLFEDQYLIAFYVAQDRGFYAAAFQHRHAHAGIAVVVYQKYTIKRYRITFFSGEPVHENRLLLFHLELLAGYFYYCVHV